MNPKKRFRYLSFFWNCKQRKKSNKRNLMYGKKDGYVEYYVVCALC